jgi:hypothetical protein
MLTEALVHILCHDSYVAALLSSPSLILAEQAARSPALPTAGHMTDALRVHTLARIVIRTIRVDAITFLRSLCRL